MALEHPFRPALFRFLRALAENNRRDWFQEHRGEYEDCVRGPALEFVAACSAPLRRLSPHLVADPRPVGGSLVRIHRDIRFSADKSPYKSAVGMRFFHEQRREVTTPGYYLHLAPGETFAALGLWQPDTATARRVREAIVADPEGWKRATRGKAFTGAWHLEGASLKRPPAGFERDHPLVEDLKRKDFTAYAKLRAKDVTARDFDKQFVALCRKGVPMVRFLCGAVGVPF